jgi:hypothetical protein
MAISKVITLIVLLQNLQGILCDNVLILKGFKTCLLFHSIRLNF